MTIASNGRPPGGHEACRIRIAAAGDIHFGEREGDHERAAETFAALQGRVDLVLLAGDRLAVPIREHGPDLVLHGHAHAGTFEGRVGEVPVYNVSVPVLGEDFWQFELTGDRRV